MTTTVSQRIKQRREFLGMTQADLAAKLGVATSHISAWENGREPRKHLCDLSIALNTSMDWIAKGAHFTDTEAA